ncbi:hypothetical protein [Dyella sp. 20L07]|uniref:hypothetical protein n=1 Tax=Dyella sp. 20L07 TaxID=3384240 RepID=UPI003D2E5EB1
MNLAALTPIVVSLGTAVLMALGGREHRRVQGNLEIYKFPSIYSYFFIGAFALFAIVACMPSLTGHDPATIATFWLFPALVFVGGLYLFRYRLVIDGDEITVGAFSRRRIDLRQVVDMKLKTGRGAELTLVFGNGSKIRLSGLLTDFDLMSQALLGRIGSQK